MAPSKLLLLNTDRIEMMVLMLGLELLRFAINVHFRGIVLSSAERLDHLTNLVKAAIQNDDLPSCSEFADTRKSSTTVWNDQKEEEKDFMRSHLIHSEMTMCVGFGQNVTQRRNWNGANMENLKVTERETKKRLRSVIFNEEVETKFSEPVFNQEKGTFNLAVINTSYSDDLDKPLLPADKEGMKKTIIR